MIVLKTMQDKALAALQSVAGIVERRQTLPILANVLLRKTGANVQLVTDDASAPASPVISVLVDDVEEAYAEAQRLGHEIVYPLTTEPWGVRRFFVRDPDGNVLNIVRHRD